MTNFNLNALESLKTWEVARNQLNQKKPNFDSFQAKQKSSVKFVVRTSTFTADYFVRDSFTPENIRKRNSRTNYTDLPFNLSKELKKSYYFADLSYFG